MFCHIHSDMSGIVFVAPNRFFTSPGIQGSYRLEGIPAGTYRITAWHERAEPVKATIRIEPGKATGSTSIFPLRMSSPQATKGRGRGSGAALFRVVRRASLTVRLAVLIGSVTAVLVGGMFVALSLGTAARTRDALTAELAGHQQSLLALQRQTLQQELVTSALIGETPSLRAALATYREEKTSGGAPRALLARSCSAPSRARSNRWPRICPRRC